MNHLIRPSFSALNTLEKLDRQQSIYKDHVGSLVRGFAAKVLLLFFGSLPFAQQCLSHFALFQVH
ncbi:hypothetical protein, partial [Pseudomonas putida]|uniref:hypothetical protein n=1 Tax=Pseudomonas putida TaxID=303 RepID=UPI0024E151A0